MPGTAAVIPITGGYAVPLLANWKLAAGQDCSVQLTVADLPADAGIAVKMIILNPDGTDLISRAATISPATVATFALVAADTSASLTGPYIYECRRTDAGFNVLLAYGTVALFQPLMS